MNLAGGEFSPLGCVRTAIQPKGAAMHEVWTASVIEGPKGCLNTAELQEAIDLVRDLRPEQALGMAEYTVFESIEGITVWAFQHHHVVVAVTCIESELTHIPSS